MERFALRFAELTNDDPRGKWLQTRFLRGVSYVWVRAMIANRILVEGLEDLMALRPTTGVMLVSNHRSFFDLYMLMLLLHRHTPLRQPVLCPVRADFFYQRAAGVVVNLLIGGGRMFPPFFREPQKAEFNKWALERVVAELHKGKVLVGFHPEGTRNKNDDAYTPLPAQPGVGKLVMETWPIVVPAFINGLSNDIIADIRGNFDGSKRVVAVFGEPIDLSPFKKLGNRLSSHKRIADALLKRIYELGEEERAYRARL